MIGQPGEIGMPPLDPPSRRKAVPQIVEVVRARRQDAIEDERRLQGLFGCLLGVSGNDPGSNMPSGP